MKQNKLSRKLLKYELLNLANNIFVIIFGLVFPIGMALLFSFAFSDMMDDKATLHTQMFLQMAIMIPMATIFMGHAVSYASELESGAVQRFKLFGYKEPTLILAKLIANFLFLAISLFVYVLVLSLTLNISAPNIHALITYLIFFFVFSAILFGIAHGIATLCGHFGITFGVVMALYFTLMILGGNMGVEPEMLPNGVRHISMCLPTYYITEKFLDFWNGGTFNFLPFILSIIGFAVISVAVVMLALWLTKKGKIKQVQ